jgi:hypothetical protein
MATTQGNYLYLVQGLRPWRRKTYAPKYFNALLAIRIVKINFINVNLAYFRVGGVGVAYGLKI